MKKFAVLLLISFALGFVGVLGDIYFKI